MFRISLQQMFLFVAAIALAIVSLKYASPTWRGVIGLATLLTLFAVGIVGIFERGPRQAFGIAMALVMLFYGLLLVEWLGVRQQLPTSQLLLSLHGLVQKQAWVNPATGEVLVPSQMTAVVWSSSSGYSMNGVPIELRQSAPVEAFVPIGHCWWALLLGCLGGWFAQTVYTRRSKEHRTQAHG